MRIQAISRQGILLLEFCLCYNPYFSRLCGPSGYSDSNAEVAMLDVAGTRQRFGVPGPHHASALDDGVAVGDAGESVDVLVDHQDRLSGGAKLLQAAPD